MSQQRGLDDKDLQLVALLQQDAWMTHAELGERIHLSASAVQRRMDKLRSEGVISGAKATVNQSRIGKGLRVYLLLELNNDGQAALEGLVSDLEEFDEVIQIDLVSGKFDIIMTLDCRDTEHFTNFAMGQLNSNPNIRHCWTLMRLKKLF